jgi:hypothetical protein
MAQHKDEPSIDTGAPLDDDRRKFLAACGKFAVVTPPALTVLLSTSLSSKAITNSGGRDDRGDHGDHDRDHRDDLFDWIEKWFGKLF